MNSFSMPREGSGLVLKIWCFSFKYMSLLNYEHAPSPVRPTEKLGLERPLVFFYYCFFTLLGTPCRLSSLHKAILDSIVVSIPACHAGDRGSIPRRGGTTFLEFLQGVFARPPSAPLGKDCFCCFLRQQSIVGSVVECSPATRAARVRFPDVASFNIFNFLNF